MIFFLFFLNQFKFEHIIIYDNCNCFILLFIYLYMLEIIYWILGFITWTVFLLLIWYGVINFICWFNENYWITYDAKKQKLIKDQMSDIFWYYFISFNFDSKILILNKWILKDSWITILKNWADNIKSLYFPANSIHCYETNENVIVLFSYKMEWIDLSLAYWI